MDIRALMVFKTVAMEKSMTKAAEKLNYVQSNVTARIQRLERELGVSLFYRHNRTVTLTPAGRGLLLRVNTLLQNFEDVVDAVTHSSEPRGTLSIGAIESTMSARLPRIFAQYHQQCPQVELRFHMAPTVELIGAVLRYEVDGAFVDGPVLHPEMTEHPVFEESLVLIAPSAPEPFRFDSVLHEPLLSSFIHCIYLGRWQRWLTDNGHAPMRVMEYGTLDGVLQCIEHGVGVTVLPRSLLDASRPGSERFRCHPLPGPYAVVPTVFIRRRDAHLTPALIRFLDLAGGYPLSEG